MIPSIYAPQPGDVETMEKMQKLQALADAIHRARLNLAEKKTPQSAIELQALKRQRQELQGTMPKLRIV
jgi:hypothetical protein